MKMMIDDGMITFLWVSELWICKRRRNPKQKSNKQSDQKWNKNRLPASHLQHNKLTKIDGVFLDQTTYKINKLSATKCSGDNNKHAKKVYYYNQTKRLPSSHLQIRMS